MAAKESQCQCLTEQLDLGRFVKGQTFALVVTTGKAHLAMLEIGSAQALNFLSDHRKVRARDTDLAGAYLKRIGDRPILHHEHEHEQNSFMKQLGIGTAKCLFSHFC